MTHQQFIRPQLVILTVSRRTRRSWTAMLFAWGSTSEPRSTQCPMSRSRGHALVVFSTLVLSVFFFVSAVGHASLNVDSNVGTNFPAALGVNGAEGTSAVLLLRSPRSLRGARARVA